MNDTIPQLVLDAFPKLQGKGFVRRFASAVPLVPDTTFDVFATGPHDFFALIATDYADPSSQSDELKSISGSNQFEFTSIQKPFDATGEVINMDKIDEIDADWFVVHADGGHSLYYYVANLRADPSVSSRVSRH